MSSPDTYERTLSEQIRDLYLDSVTDMILASEYRGRIRLLADTELDEYFDRDPGKVVAHMLLPSEMELATVLDPSTGVEVINLYLPSGSAALSRGTAKQEGVKPWQLQ